MIRPLTASILLMCLIVAGLAVLGVARGREVRPTAVVLLEAMLIGQAVIDAVSLLAGHRSGEPATHIGYLLASVALLPLLAPRVSSPDRWSAAGLIVAAAGVFVVCVRMWATYRTPGV